MHAYDRGKPFIPTLFEAIPGMEEYRMISWLPRDPVFEERLVAPVPTERQLRDKAFIETHDLGSNSWYGALAYQYDLLEPTYAVWSRSARIGLEHLHGTIPQYSSRPPEPNRVELRAQLYLAMDTTGGTFHCNSAAVFDGMRSLHAAGPRPWTRAFLNIGFDLAEMDHRRMKERLDVPGMTVDKARRIHAEHEARLRDTLDTYVRHTRRGESMALLYQWNSQVKDSLGINNMRLVEHPPLVHDLLPLPTCATHPHLGLCDIVEPH